MALGVTGDGTSNPGTIGIVDEGGFEAGLTSSWRDPGQLLRTGPCCLNNPAKVKAIEQRETVQEDLEITSRFAPIVHMAILF